MSEPDTLSATSKNTGFQSLNVLILGATGTIGQAVCRALLAEGHKPSCFMRNTAIIKTDWFSQTRILIGDVTSKASLREVAFSNETYDAVVSCLGSRTGTPEDAWAIDHSANAAAIAIAAQHGVKHFLLLSAICVQRPKLAFQFAKLEAEQTLVDSGMTYSIIRPTAFFKSLSGQIERVKAGKAFLVFGDGQLTACKPISDQDLGNFFVECLSNTDKHNRILPIGGPGPAITPKMQGQQLFELVDRPVRFKHVPIYLIDAIIAALNTLGVVIPKCKDKAALARIGRYYATESMLVWDEKTGQYSADQTPSTGTQTLTEFYAQVVRDNVKIDLGDHAVF